MHARARRRKIAEFAGQGFVPGDEVRSAIPELADRTGEQFLFAFREHDDQWTALSVQRLFSKATGKLSELELSQELDLIQQYYSGDGGKWRIDIELVDGRQFWMKSLDLSYSMHNLMIMLGNLPQGARLEN